jgi:hypothetical protein
MNRPSTDQDSQISFDAVIRLSHDHHLGEDIGASDAGVSSGRHIFRGH